MTRTRQHFDTYSRFIQTHQQKPYTGSSSTSQLLKQVYGFFPTTDVNLPICSDSSQLLKTVYGFFPTTDVNLPTDSDSSQFLKIGYGRFPTTDAAPLLVQSQLLKIVYGSSRHGRQSVACSDPNSEIFQNRDALMILVHSPLTYSSTSPYGIYKPILLPAVAEWHL